MKKFILYSLLFLCLSLTSCVSVFNIPKEKEYYILPQVSTEYSICLNSIEVKKDTISDSDLISQIQDISTTLLSDLINKDYDSTLHLNLEIKQRSYYKGIRQQNSIYFVYSLIDESERVVFNSSYSLDCSGTIESSTIDYKLIEHMNKRIRSFLKKCENIKIK